VLYHEIGKLLAVDEYDLFSILWTYSNASGVNADVVMRTPFRAVLLQGSRQTLAQRDGRQIPPPLAWMYTIKTSLSSLMIPSMPRHRFANGLPASATEPP